MQTWIIFIGPCIEIRSGLSVNAIFKRLFYNSILRSFTTFAVKDGSTRPKQTIFKQI